MERDDVTFTNKIATHIAKAANTPLDKAVSDKTRLHLLDTLAAAISGSQLKAGRLAADYARHQRTEGPCTIFGTQIKTLAHIAALSNGMSAHADETDDSHPASTTHPGCAVVPAALALGEKFDARMEHLLRAVALGYDLTARFAGALGGRAFIYKGFDSHAFGGIFGATAAAASLTLSAPEKIADALAYTAEQASGLSTIFKDHEHVEKAFVFGGKPARDAVSAIEYVLAGWPGTPLAFDGTPSFFSGFPAVAMEEWFGALGAPSEILNTNIKRWSVASPAQAAIDAVEALLANGPIPVDQIEHIKITLPASEASAVDNSPMPSVNVQYLCAIALIDGRLTFEASHNADRMTDTVIQSLRSKMEVIHSEDLDRAKTRRQGIVEITMKNGEILRHHAKAVRGTTDNPATQDEVSAKALDLMAPVLSATRAQQLIDTTLHSDDARSVRDLVTLTIPASGA